MARLRRPLGSFGAALGFVRRRAPGSIGAVPHRSARHADAVRRRAARIRTAANEGWPLGFGRRIGPTPDPIPRSERVHDSEVRLLLVQAVECYP